LTERRVSENESAPTSSLIGASVPRVEGRDKVSGALKYAIDHYPERLLWAGALRAGVARGRLVRVDVAPALLVPGVFAALTSQDVPGSNRLGIVVKDTPLLVEETIRCAADPVALVLAESRDALRRGLEAVEIEIEPLPPVLDPVLALEADAPNLHDRPKGNLLASAELVRGRGEDALADCAVVVRGEFETPMQAHAFLEPENGVAWIEKESEESDGTLVLVASTQAPHRDRLELAHALGLPLKRIRVLAPPLGGGFGGKDGVTAQGLLALAALHAQGRPVKMVWEREESFAAGYKRHPARLRYALGAQPDGRLHCLVAEFFYDTGAYAHLGTPIMSMGLEHAAGPYFLPHARVRGNSVHTNNPTAGAMRAFGAVQPAFAMERLLDELAAGLGLDPLEIRRRNALRPGDANLAGVLVSRPTGLLECLERLGQSPRWRERQAWRDAAPRYARRGVGLACAMHAMGYGRNVTDLAIAKIELNERGSLRLYVGISDMGQGNATAYAQIAAETLRQTPESIELVWPDTSRTPYAGSAAASRTVFAFGQALIEACEQLRDRLLRRAALLFQRTHVEDFALQSGCVHDARTGRALPLALLAGLMQPEERVCIGERLTPEPAQAPASAPRLAFGFPHGRFCYAAHLACVEIDELTGKTRIDRYLAATSAGRVLNPQGYEQQIQGAIAQGIGYALSEECAVQDGIVGNTSFSSYVIPTSLDLPDVESYAVEAPDPEGPFGLKGVGEIGAVAPLPALANAIANALPPEAASRLRAAPLTPERVLAALNHARSNSYQETP
jgi:CO/xanthine dehydrogenase Mo-binding subunit